MPPLHPIRMVDLQRQYNRIRPSIDEAIDRVLKNGTFIGGAEVSAFESRLAAFCGVNHAISCGNGTDALQLALMALNLPAGSQVITPAFSYAAVAEVCHLMGLEPVYADIHPDTFLMDPEGLETLITPKTRCIIPVHLFGQVTPMDRIMELAAKHSLFVIEDNAQSIGAEHIAASGKRAFSGSIGHLSTTSFFPSKNLGCYGDGGAVMTNDQTLAARVSMLANHGQSEKYHHKIIGINSRLDAIQAAVLSVKLNHLAGFTEQRRQVASAYDRLFENVKGLQTPVRADHSTHVFHQYTLKLADQAIRDSLQQSMNAAGIPCAIYYPMPLYMQEAYRQDLKLSISEDICTRVLSIPMGTDMDQDQVEYIAEHIINHLR